MEGMKQCSKCKEKKPLSNFYNTRNGYMLSKCRSCIIKSKPQGEFRKSFTGETKTVECKRRFWNLYQIDPEKSCNEKPFREFQAFENSKKKERAIFF